MEVTYLFVFALELFLEVGRFCKFCWVKEMDLGDGLELELCLELFFNLKYSPASFGAKKVFGAFFHTATVFKNCKEWPCLSCSRARWARDAQAAPERGQPRLERRSWNEADGQGLPVTRQQRP